MPYLIYAPFRCGVGAPYAFSAVTLEQKTMIEDFRVWGWRVEHHLPCSAEYLKHLQKEPDLRRWRPSIEAVWRNVCAKLEAQREGNERKEKEREMKAKGWKGRLIGVYKQEDKKNVGVEEMVEEEVGGEEMCEWGLDREMMDRLREYERSDGRDWI